MELLRATLRRPLEVERCRVASPPMAKTLQNSATEAATLAARYWVSIRLRHSNKISTVQFGIQLCHTDPRLSCSFSTLNPRADIDRWDFHSVRLFTVEIWLE